MYWLMLFAHPQPANSEYGTVDAAWVSCFVNTDDAEEAEASARSLLADGGWDTEELEDAKPVVREDLLGNADALEKFDQALVDGVVVTINSWNVGAPEE
jgi:hypothetical protein